MAQQPTVHPKYWGACTHEECHKANHPHDAYLKLYKKQYPAAAISTIDSSSIHQLESTMSVLNPVINDILFDDTLWSKHFRYKHKNPSYLDKQITETFYEWYCNTLPTHQIPQFKQRNCISLIPITDDKSYFIDNELIKKLSELTEIFYGLKIKDIDITNTENNVYPSDVTADSEADADMDGKFVSKDLHNKLTKYYQSDLDIFAIIGICCKIGMFSKENKVCHGESNQYTQSAICSFSKLGIYNKNIKNIPEWLKIRRAGKILLHEIGHLYGIQHCEYFRCLMNKDVVLDNVPMTLCPICLNKLYFSMIKHNLNRNTFESKIEYKQTDNTDKQNIDDHNIIYQHQHKHDHIIEEEEDNDMDNISIASDESGLSGKGPSSNNVSDEDEPEHKNNKLQTTVGVDHDDIEVEDDDENIIKWEIDHNTFNLYQRYQKLAEWFNEHKLFREATWYKNRLSAFQIRGGFQ